MRYDMAESNNSKEKNKFEAHIFFDDAIESGDAGSRPNAFVQTFIGLVGDAADFMHKREVGVKEPSKVIT